MVLDHARKVVYRFPSRASEWVTTFILFNWSLLVFISHGEVLAREAYASLLGIMSPEFWGFTFLGVSTARFLILYINGALKRSPHYRSAMSFITCFAWFQITISFLTAEVVSTALAVYPVLLALDFYNAYRTAIEARITDEVNKQVDKEPESDAT